MQTKYFWRPLKSPKSHMTIETFFMLLVCVTKQHSISEMALTFLFFPTCLVGHFLCLDQNVIFLTYQFSNAFPLCLHWSAWLQSNKPPTRVCRCVCICLILARLYNINMLRWSQCNQDKKKSIIYLLIYSSAILYQTGFAKIRIKRSHEERANLNRD